MIWDILGGSSNGGGMNTEGTVLQTLTMHDHLQDPSWLWPDEYEMAVMTNNKPWIDQLQRDAIEYELKYPQYWKRGDNSQRTPKPILSSSWVRKVDYDPTTGMAHITFDGGDKAYTYRDVTPEQMHRFLTSASLGRVINESKKLGDPSKRASGAINWHGLAV